MTFLSGDELAQLRADALDLLTDSCVIERANLATDAYGHSSESWTAAGTAVCRLDPFNRLDPSGIIAGREANRVTYRLTLPWDTDIQDGDRVQVNGQTLEVLQLHDAHSARSVRRALVAGAAG